MENNIYNNGAYLSQNENWHSEDSVWKSNHIANIIIKNNIKLNNICEVGCGAGNVLISLSKIIKLKEYAGYDISKDAINLCIKDIDNIKFYNENFLLSNKNYDCILCIDVLEHIESHFDFLRELRNKSIYHVFHIPLDLNILNILRNKLIDKKNKIGHLHYFDPDLALSCLKDCGYNIIDYNFTPSFIGLNNNSSFKGKILDKFRCLLYYFFPSVVIKWLGGCSILILTHNL